MEGVWDEKIYSAFFTRLPDHRNTDPLCATGIRTVHRW